MSILIIFNLHLLISLAARLPWHFLTFKLRTLNPHETIFWLRPALKSLSWVRKHMTRPYSVVETCRYIKPKCDHFFRPDMTNWTAKYHPLDLGIGFPDFLPPQHIRKALVDVAKTNNALLHQYTRPNVTIIFYSRHTPFFSPFLQRNARSHYNISKMVL